jgi:membrane-bound lytic murein transglycosylase F
MSTTAKDNTTRTRPATRRERLALGLLGAALAGLLTHHALTLPLPRTLLVAAPRQSRMAEDSPANLERQLLARFAASHGVSLKYVFTATPEEALDMVERGHAQIGLALGVVPGGETAKEIRAEEHAPKKVAFGPEYDRQTIYAVDWDAGYEPPARPSGAMDELLRVAESFSREPRVAPALPLDALHLLLPFVSEVRDVAPTRREAGYRFVWRKDVPGLDKAMSQFWKQIETDGTLAALRESTIGFLPADPDPYEMETLRRTVAISLPEHMRAIRRAARRWALDPFLLAAVIHQESRFDPDAVSVTGVRGLMQMTGDTLEQLGVKHPDDPAEVIDAGARYLDSLRAQFVEQGYAREDAMLLALAAFNVGAGHVQDAIDLSHETGATPPPWLRVRQMLPKLEETDFALNTRYGQCRGGEAVEFVDKVRYFAFAIRGLVLSSAERDQLPGLRLAALTD